MTDKPLSETHPTFTAKHNMMMSWGEMNMLRLSRCIRETTVDIAEYERLKKELESAWVTINDLDVRLERAVAEHEKLYSKGFDAGVKETHGRVEHVGYQEGIAEGERRIIQRVRQNPMSEETLRDVFGCARTISAERPISPEECGCIRCFGDPDSFALGENRAMERVLETIEKHEEMLNGQWFVNLSDLYKELGLKKSIDNNSQDLNT